MNEITPASRTGASFSAAMTASLAVLLVAACTAIIIVTRWALALAMTSALIAAACHHLVDWLERHRFRHGWALAATLLAFALLIAGVLLVIVPPAVSQGSTLVAQAPDIVAKAQNTALYQQIEGRFHLTEQVSSNASQSLQTAAAPVVRAIEGLLALTGELATMGFLAVFMLIFGPRLVSAILSEIPPGRRGRYATVVRKIYESVGGYITGLGFICTTNAVLATTFLAIARVPFFLPLGLASGVSSLVPYVGPVTAGIVITLLALATRGVWVGVATLVYFLCYFQLEGQVLAPLVYRRTVHVSPLVTLLAILFMAEVAGVVGAIVAVPVAAAAQVILREILLTRRERLHLQ